MIRRTIQNNAQLLLILSLGLLLEFGGVMPHALCYGREQTFHHEITTGIQWSQDDYTYDNYVVNQIPSPSVSGQLDQEYWVYTNSYSFFFHPLVSDEETPIVLQHFYTHPTTLRIHFSLQPEAETIYTHQNVENNYRSQTFKDVRSRSAGIDFEYYFLERTGILFQLSSKKDEEDVRTSTTLNYQGVGEHNEIRRQYGIGLSHYFQEHFNIRLNYTFFDDEFVGIEKNWETDSPLLITENGQESDAEGSNFVLSGQYIIGKTFGIHCFYKYQQDKNHSNIISSYYDNFPGADYFYDDDTTSNTFGTSVSIYFNQKTTLQIEGSYLNQKRERDYEVDQVTDYDWDVFNLGTRIIHYLNPHLGIQVGYEFSKRDGDILIEHPEAEGNPQTTYCADSDVHAIYATITGRF